MLTTKRSKPLQIVFRDHYLFMGQPANALAFGVAILALYAVYVARDELYKNRSSRKTDFQ